MHTAATLYASPGNLALSLVFGLLALVVITHNDRRPHGGGKVAL